MTQIERVGAKFLLLLAVAFAGWVWGASLLVHLSVLVVAICGLSFYGLVLVLMLIWAVVKSQVQFVQWREHLFQMLIWLYCASLFAGFLGSGNAKSKWMVTQSRQFVAEMSPQLDSIARKTGRFPKKLLPDARRKMPIILSYFSDGKTYSFSYSPSLSIGINYRFNSATQSWERQFSGYND